MNREHHFRFPLPNGLHARPASHLAERAGAFASVVTFVNERSGRSANARSVLALIGTDTRLNDPCCLRVEGDGTESSFSALVRFLESDFLTCDEPLVVECTAPANPTIPRSLTVAGLVVYYPGMIACRGLGFGRVLRVGAFEFPGQLADEAFGGAANEQTRFDMAVAAVRSDYERKISGEAGSAAAILHAHVSLLKDPSLTEKIGEFIQGGQPAGRALREAIAMYSEVLTRAESAYLRERVLDLEDIAAQLFNQLFGPSSEVPVPNLKEPSILVAEQLTPGRFLALDRTLLRGLVLGHAGQTSHTVILARSFGIPTLTGVNITALSAAVGRPAILDTHLGFLVIDPPGAVADYYVEEQKHHALLYERALAKRDQPATTRDGRRFEIGANIASAAEAEAAFGQGAEGIGLFRTELLFTDRSQPPGEEEQTAIYTAVVRAAAGRPVIIRTLDIGGDKPVPFLKLPAEKNPFLGYRGARLYNEFREIVLTQFRALWRAAKEGPLKVMVPMIAHVEEARSVRELYVQARSSVHASGVPCGESMPFGLMLEVPSAAYQIYELCETAEFFSIGTNDLAQYFFAADRENEKVSDRYGPFQPSFLRLLKHLVTAAHVRNRWIGLCGEMAENAAALPLLLGLELDEISLAAPRIPATKAALAQLSFRESAGKLERALQAATRDAVLEQLVEAPRPTPMLTAELVLDNLNASSKAAAIHAMTLALHRAGRTQDPASLENAVWAREDTYTTGFGDGFAVPHCKSDVITANSIVIARLKKPIEWQSLDGKPVSVAIMLVIRAGEHERTHLKALARLSRLVVQDHFRDLVGQHTDPAELAAYVLGQIAETPAEPAT